jgi:hypothetical protein
LNQRQSMVHQSMTSPKLTGIRTVATREREQNELVFSVTR